MKTFDEIIEILCSEATPEIISILERVGKSKRLEYLAMNLVTEVITARDYETHMAAIQGFKRIFALCYLIGRFEAIEELTQLKG